MQSEIARSVRALSHQTVADLERRYAEVFGEPATSRHKRYLIKRIIWRMQALREGDITDRARQRAVELARDAEIRLTAPSLPPGEGECTVSAACDPRGAKTSPQPGSMLRREYKGRVIHVRVLPKGYEYEGEVYRSLTAIAQKVTGAHWNGLNFFRLPASRGKAKEVR